VEKRESYTSPCAGVVAKTSWRKYFGGPSYRVRAYEVNENVELLFVFLKP